MAKCLAASNPKPIFAPTTITVFPDRSVLTTAGIFLHWSQKKAKRDLRAIVESWKRIRR